MERALKILIVDDEQIVREGIANGLRLEGYEVHEAGNGTLALEMFEKDQPNLVILDLMMPGIDGIEVCKAIRNKTPDLPVIMLTAKNSELDKVLGLEMGADDYLTKPFGLRELLARIKAVTRRSRYIPEVEIIEIVEFSDITVNFRTLSLLKNGEDVGMSVKEFELLRYLINKKNTPVSRDELLDHVWGYNSYPTTRTVDNFIARLRQKVENEPETPKHILTVHGMGYKFVDKLIKL